MSEDCLHKVTITFEEYTHCSLCGSINYKGTYPIKDQIHTTRIGTSPAQLYKTMRSLEATYDINTNYIPVLCFI